MGSGRSVKRVKGKLLIGERKQLNQLKAKLILLGTNYEEQRIKHNVYVRTADQFQVTGRTWSKSKVSGRYSVQDRATLVVDPIPDSKEEQAIRAEFQKQIETWETIQEGIETRD